LHRLNLLTIVDRATLAAYCQAWSRWVEAEANIQRFGAVIKTPKGLPLVNPYPGADGCSGGCSYRKTMHYAATACEGQC